MKHIKTIIGLLLLGVLFIGSGCANQAIKSGNIISITSRTFGITVAESASSGTPAVKLGFNSETVQFTPTSTNGPVYAPKYANTFKIGQAAVPFTFDVNETFASGDVQTGSGTNESSVAIVPK